MDELIETRDFRDSVADDWRIQVGHSGDANRRLNSDPVLWSFAGDVTGLRTLDAGCGVGYLSKQLAERGALVVGVDLSERMIENARQHYPALDFRVDSCSELSTVGDAEFDLVVSNYVLMDAPDLNGAVESFYRVLKPGGRAALVFSHPCFPQGQRTAGGKPPSMSYQWDASYFEQRRCVDPPWKHFKSEFIWFHRPLSDYWKAFTAAGFEIVEFEEPRLTEDRYHLAPSAKELESSKHRPYSVAFKLLK